MTCNRRPNYLKGLETGRFVKYFFEMWRTTRTCLVVLMALMISGSFLLSTKKQVKRLKKQVKQLMQDMETAKENATYFQNQLDELKLCGCPPPTPPPPQFYSCKELNWGRFFLYIER